MSFLRHLYYELKPFIPQAARLAFRRSLARTRLGKSSHVWPINPTAAHKPKDWKGWPNGKNFAFVLTHDVEGRSGLAKCRDLIRIEKDLGFRSSFNFIPEGTYEIPVELRKQLYADGFEVGVHDLKHDGKLYRSKDHFCEAAKRINSYLHDWQAVGFRSGFMHHNLDWLHKLNIAYDMSTFDTDPFEPQPDGTGTIFPFVVNEKSGKGYVELSYTLPQDSTLFLILRQRNIDIWKRKLAWIAENGGMALVNVHPDYLSFNGVSDVLEYPVALFADLLDHVRTTYKDEYWQALPREVAAMVTNTSKNSHTSLESASSSSLRTGS